MCRLVPAALQLRRCCRLVAESPSMQALILRAAPIAASDAPVVISGESGTGKEVLARALQAKLLGVLQDGEVRRLGDTRPFSVDARVLCTTNQDLRACVARLHFREDLYYRLQVVTLLVPPLRERRVESAQGGGSTFTVLLPALDGIEPSAEASS